MRRHVDSLLRAAGVRAPRLDTYAATELTRHRGLSASLGVELYLKREDRLDDLGCGHKMRKLAYVVAAALAERATVLVTGGSVPSNQCKAVAVAAQQHGLRAHVVYAGDRQERPSRAQGNYWLTSLLQPDISWFERAPWREVDARLREVVEAERTRGQRPYLIGPGASDWPGILGSLELGLELGAQARELGLKRLELVAPAGSGGTCAGLALAAAYLELDWTVHGMCIGEAAASVGLRGQQLQEAASRTLRSCRPRRAALRFHDVALGAGYDNPTSQELDAMRLVLQRFGLVFDPNYMLKAYLGLQRLLQGGVIAPSSPIVLIHTGGQMGLFDAHPRIADWQRHTSAAWLSRPLEAGIS